ncbi:hypothetical protein BN946_scf185008.g86 [Trametes cinnabarina]|uniref:Heme peroxidase n=1 Tax=Pycnoporus cinnabarinus TaxID=5643 RepID=A0A060SLN7_PYCCI|nr:hypothetical protein BN946_scf185008.g86 [Trametes cinnabarina]
MSISRTNSMSVGDASGAPAVASSTMKGFQEFREQIKKHLPFASDLSTIESIIDGIKHLNSVDDRKMLMEHIMVYLSQNASHPMAQKLETAVVQLLYNDLPHPAITSIGPQYAYRAADGSNNNPSAPNLGKAGTPVFRTSHKDVSINDTSSYIDLAPLYGHTQEAQDKIRVRNVCVLLVLFNRNHNYIAHKLLELNERGTYVDPNSIPTSDPARADKLLAQEEDIFQTARLINCGWFASVVFSDYFSAILGLVREGSNWALDPFEEMRNIDHSLFERGRGNVCSVEFNCLYRWHATTSEADEQWVQKLSEQLFPGRTVESVTIEDFKQVAKTMMAKEPDVTHWTFGDLQRDRQTNKFDDKGLANILQTATEHPAGAFKARGTPYVMRLHEIMGIEQNRAWGVCSLNDFRKVYCQRDPDGPGNGSMLGRLLLRTLPGQYASDNTYTWFPLMTPPAMERILNDLGTSGLYETKRAGSAPSVQVLGTWQVVSQVLQDEGKFVAGFPERAAKIVNGPGFFIASNDPAGAAREQRAMLNVLAGDPYTETATKRFFFEKTREFMLRESCSTVASPVRSVDIVRNVFRAVPIYWVAELTGIRLKSSADAAGDYTPAELFDVLARIYTYLFLDIGAEHFTKLQKNVTAEVAKLKGIIRQRLGASRGLSLAGLFETVTQLFTKQAKSSQSVFAERLHALGYDAETQCNLVFALVVGATVELSQAMVNVLNFYLDPPRSADVQKLASRPQRDPKDEAQLQGFVLEALRLDSTFRGVYRKTVDSVQMSQGTLPPQQRVFLDIATANTSIIVEALRGVYSFPTIMRGPGLSGQLKRYKEDSAMTSTWSYLGPDQRLSPWATSMVVQVTYGFYTVSPGRGANRSVA